MTVGDFMQDAFKSSFAAAWNDLGPENEMTETFKLSQIRSMGEAVKILSVHLGMTPCERTDTNTEGKACHSLHLSGER